MDFRIETSRTIGASAADIFAVLSDPQGHVAIDASGMLQDADGKPVTAAGDRFVVHMDREALGDVDMGKYDVDVTIRDFEQDRLITWMISMNGRSPIGYYYGYRLEPADVPGSTTVTAIYDWADLSPRWKANISFPVVPESALKGTLGILDRTVRRGYPRG